MSNAAQLLLKRNRARSNLLDFTTFTKNDYQISWHHRLICEKLDQMAAGDIKRLLISVPVRHGKSELVSRRFPAFLLGINPDVRIIACSYSADLSQRLNRDIQRIIDSPEYKVLFPDTKLNSSNVRTTAQGSWLRNSDLFEIVGHKGVYRSAGVGGGITGLGGDFLILDDPLKNHEEANSETVRNKIWEWYSAVFHSRQEKDAAILITMTRWHPDDIAGKVLELAQEDPNADQWEVITLPALSEDELAPYDQRTGPDQALWPGKYPEETLLKTKATVPTYTWLSLYQQRPSAAKGNLFKRENFQYFTESQYSYDLQGPSGLIQVPKASCIIFQTCDPAGTAKTHSDYFVLSTWALTPKRDLLLLNVFRTKIEGADHMEFFRVHSKFPGLAFIGFESVGIGKTTYQNLVRERFPVVDLKPQGDKFTRALSAAIRLGAKTTYFKSGAPWLSAFEEELLKFPNVKNDDQVDTLSQADYCITMNMLPSQQTQYETHFIGCSSTSSDWGGGGWIRV